MSSHIQFRVVTPGKTSKRIERVQDAVCAAKKAGSGARIVSENTRSCRPRVDVTVSATKAFGHRRCR